MKGSIIVDSSGLTERISSFSMKKILTLMLIAGIGLSWSTATGQNVLTDMPDKAITDSIGTANEAAGNGRPAGTPSLPSITGQELLPKDSLINPDITVGSPSLQSSYPKQLQPFTMSVPTDGRIVVWNSGGLFANGGSASMPGMMGIESGSLILMQQAGRFTFTAHGDAMKYGYFGGLQTVFGFGGSISYRFSDRVSMTLFGSYYTSINNATTLRHAGMTPGMQGYTAIPNFGGYIDYRIGDRWGVKVGAQAYRSSVTNRYEAQPMVIPYYRLSKHAEIGLDVGGILYQLIKSNQGKSMHGNMNPTIAPPVFGPPPVR